MVPAESSPFFTIPQPFSKLHDTKGLGTSFDVTHPGFILLDAVEVAGGDQMLEIPYDMGQWLGVRKRTTQLAVNFTIFATGFLQFYQSENRPLSAKPTKGPTQVRPLPATRLGRNKEIHRNGWTTTNGSIVSILVSFVDMYNMCIYMHNV